MAQLSLPLRLDDGTVPAFRGEVNVPGSKSISNRLLLINHLAGNPLGHVEGLSTAGDTIRMQAVLQVISQPSGFYEVMVGDAGTVMRFVVPVLCITPGTHRMTGSGRAHERPIGPLVDALRLLGAQIQYLEREGCLPLQIEGGAPLAMPAGLDAMVVDAGISSQFVSALLLVAPYIPGGLRLRLSDRVVSRPYIHLTLDLMRGWGIDAKIISENEIFIPQNRYQPPTRFEVEPDWSSAAYWLAWTALMPGTELFIPRLKLPSLQADAVCVEAFAQLGVQAMAKEDGLLLRHQPMGVIAGEDAPCGVSEQKLGRVLNNSDDSFAVRPELYLDFSGVDSPDLMPTALVLCALKNQAARFTGLESLRVKESDRLEGLLTGLRALGAHIEEGNPGEYCLLRGVPVAADRHQVIDVVTRGDHRMAMAFSLLASQGYCVRFDTPDVVVKSYPAYWNELERLGMRWQP